MVAGFGFVIWVWVWLDDQRLVGLDLGFWCGGFEIDVDRTGDQHHSDSLSFSHSDSLSQIGFVFWYCFDFFFFLVVVGGCCDGGRMGSLLVGIG